jgi:hypothetical protein
MPNYNYNIGRTPIGYKNSLVADYVPCDEGAVIKYLHERSKKTEVRARVFNRFNNIINNAIARNKRRLRGMSMSEALRRGTDLIANADYFFLIELKNARRGDFITTLFDFVRNN